MTFSEFFQRYVYLRKCVSCGERLGYEYRNDAYCDACRVAFEKAKSESCPECMRAMADCRCVAKRLSEAGVKEHRKLFYYRKSEPWLPENKLVYFLKNHKNARVATFAAEQLSYRIDELLADEGLLRDEVVITYIPRSRRSYAVYGVDQAELVAKALGRVAHIECLPLIKRVHDGKSSQKKLTVKQRLKNTKGMFAFNKKCASLVNNRAVILYDDVVTTGISAYRAVSALKSVGVEKIYLFSLAYTPK